MLQSLRFSTLPKSTCIYFGCACIYLGCGSDEESVEYVEPPREDNLKVNELSIEQTQEVCRSTADAFRSVAKNLDFAKYCTLQFAIEPDTTFEGCEQSVQERGAACQEETKQQFAEQEINNEACNLIVQNDIESFSGCEEMTVQEAVACMNERLKNYIDVIDTANCSIASNKERQEEAADKGSLLESESSLSEQCRDMSDACLEFQLAIIRSFDN